MLSLMFLVPIAVILAIVAMGFFLWAVRNGQYDDLDKDGTELLFDDENTARDESGKGAEDDS
mgnify:CR=1 FL=1